MSHSPTPLRIACLWFSSPLKNGELERFAETCLRFSPQIALRARQAIFIEIGKSRTLFSEEAFIRRVRVLLRRFGLSVSGAVRSRAIDALLAARYGSHLPEALPLEALALVLDPFGIREKEDELPATEKMTVALQALGLRSLHDFMSLPPHELPSRFGAEGRLCRLHLERGEFTWPTFIPQEVIEESRDLADDEACGTLEPLLFYAKTLLDRLFARLHGRGLRLTRLQARFELERFSTVRKPVHEWDFDLMLPQGSTSGVLPILRERWDRDLQHEPLEALVTRLHFTVMETVAGYDGQKNFFHAREDQTEKMNAVASHLRESLGADKVFRASLVEDRIPEKSWRKLEKNERPAALDLSDRIPLRPTRILQPETIEVSANQVTFRRRRWRIERRSEVERISAHWLDGLQVRHYVRLDLEHGPSLWVFEDANGTFLQGVFE